MNEVNKIIKGVSAVEIGENSGATDMGQIDDADRISPLALPGTVERLSTTSHRISITADIKAKSNIILHVLCVTFHHRNGPQVEYVTPPFPGREPLGDSFESDGSRTAIGLPDEWSFFPFLCLPDGAHASEEEFIYFHLPPVAGWENYNTTFLNMSIGCHVSDSTLYSGISLRELVNKFKQKTLQLFKLFLLEKRVLFYGPKVEALSSYQYSLISLMPDLLRHLHDVGAPNLSYEENGFFSPEDTADAFKQKLRNLGLPLRIFGEGAFFQPYIPLQQVDVLMAPETKSFLVGTSNSIFLHNKTAKIDAIVNCEKGTIEVIDPVLMQAMSLTSADKRFIDDDPTLNQQIEFEGSDDDIRARFESYLFSFLVSAKLTLEPPEVAPASSEGPVPKRTVVIYKFTN
ncbi:UNVERIFIED_CONTAM: late secretory pathway protein avl9 [Siphonaria sp. JEL0065]|nr:late secretory pathway protein avl9 [Siphonaria sp. JEL0065]